MENSYHAIIIAGMVLIFVVALSIAVLTYNRLFDAVDDILTDSEYYGRTAENYVESVVDTDRVISGAEVVNQILELVTYPNNNKEFARQQNDYKYHKITVNVGSKKYEYERKLPQSSKMSLYSSSLSKELYTIASNNFTEVEYKFTNNGINVTYK